MKRSRTSTKRCLNESRKIREFSQKIFLSIRRREFSQRIRTPIKKEEPTKKKDDKISTTSTEALRITGALLWLTTRTRIDLALVSHKSAKTALNDSAYSVAVGKRGLRYLKGTTDYAIVYSPGPKDQADRREALDTYSDASHMADWERSQLGVVCYLNYAPIAWRTTMAPLAAGSTCESELQAAMLGCQMAIGLATLLEDLGMIPEVWHGIDNQASLTVLQDTSSWRTRHLAIRSAVLRDMVREGIIKCTHVRSRDQRADGLTKFLKPELHKLAVENWNIKPMSMVFNDAYDNNANNDETDTLIRTPALEAKGST